MPAGRPPLFNSADELQTKIDEYFQAGTTAKPTISGLAYHLGFESRQSFYDYEETPEFSYTIKRARARIEINYEERLTEAACTGAIFALKNLGWKDESQFKHTGQVGISWQEIKNYGADDKTNEST